MGKVRNNQINQLIRKYSYSVERENGDETSPVVSVTFYRNENTSENSVVKVVFQDYFITGFPGFDFHTKYNNNIAPYEKVMYGKILEEKSNMYKFELHNEACTKQWTGWCPKKSCTVYKGE